MRIQLCEHELYLMNHSLRETAIAPLFKIQDETSSRSDLAARQETKFALHHADIKKLRRQLEGTGHRLVHNQQVSVVRSVYFDDSKLSAGHANLNGLGRRRKLRMRWYDSLGPGNDAYLEVKWRNNRITGKHRLKLHCDQRLSDLTYKQLGRSLMESVSPTFVPILLAYPDPVLLVEYKREHFSSADKRLRITLDYDLTFYDQTGKRSISTSFPHRMADFLVVEGKTPVGAERELREMLAPLPLKASRCSKYVHGLRNIGLIPVGI